MSIATDEADKRYPFNKEASSDDDFLLNDDNGLKNEGYIAGRTAKPTEAEIEAATTEWDRHGYCHRVDTPIVCMCGATLTDEHSYDVHLVRAMLEAARKAVTGDERASDSK